MKQHLGKFYRMVYEKPWLAPWLLLAIPLAWFLLGYVGSLVNLLINSFYSIDEFSGVLIKKFTLKTYAAIFQISNFQIISRSVVMATAVTMASIILAMPLSWFIARHAKPRVRAALYLAIMLPLWSSYLVRVYSWKLILAKEGVLTYVFTKLHLSWLLDSILSLPVIGGPSLSFSLLGTFIVFVYLWLPYMILPMLASFDRVSKSLQEASGDLGARPNQTFRYVVLPQAIPGIAAGSIFTFSLTLGDYITPSIIGSSRVFIGQAVYSYQGVAGNLPLAAVFSIAPILIMAVYLSLAGRLGAFKAL
ncbi:MAG: ABC transporter permease [Hydrotalea sp.]|nr:ABC transporter permease [Hydrotalea sp.]